MSHSCVIEGRSVDLAWTQSTARSMKFRAGKIGEDVPHLWRGLQDRNRAEYALGALLWVLSPDDLHKKHDTPESLWLTVADDEVEGVLKAVVATLGDSVPTPEKKSTLKKSRSRKSS